MKVWRTEKSIEMTATPEAVWRAWADVERWPAWNADIEHIVLDGPFATGSTITMTPHGAEPVALRVAEAREPHVFVDQADVAGTVIRTTSPRAGHPDAVGRQRDRRAGRRRHGRRRRWDRVTDWPGGVSAR